MSTWYDRQLIGRDQIRTDGITEMINIIRLDNIFNAETNLAKKIMEEDSRYDFHLGKSFC